MEFVAMKKKIALVLSGGGARGLAHIGAIETLESHGYEITSIAGCSMGALIGGMYAAGKLPEVKDWVLALDRRKVLSLVDFSLSLTHLVKGDRVMEALKEIVPDVNIEDLPFLIRPLQPIGTVERRSFSTMEAFMMPSVPVSQYRCFSIPLGGKKCCLLMADWSIHCL